MQYLTIKWSNLTLKWAHLPMTLRLATSQDWLADLYLASSKYLHTWTSPNILEIMAKFQVASCFTFRDINYFLVWILVKSHQTDGKRYIWAHRAYAQVCSTRSVWPRVSGYSSTVYGPMGTKCYISVSVCMWESAANPIGSVLVYEKDETHLVLL